MFPAIKYVIDPKAYGWAQMSKLTEADSNSDDSVLPFKNWCIVYFAPYDQLTFAILGSVGPFEMGRSWSSFLGAMNKLIQHIELNSHCVDKWNGTNRVTMSQSLF